MGTAAQPRWRTRLGSLGRVVWLAAMCLAVLFGSSARAADPCAAITPSPGLNQVVAIDPTTVWAPRGGQVKFTLSGLGSATPTAVVACFRWSNNGGAANPYRQAVVRLVDASQTPNLIYAATVPRLPAAPSDVWAFLADKLGAGDSTALGLAPLADFRVVVTTGAGAAVQQAEVVQQVGVTYHVVAVLITVLLIVAAWGLLYACGRQRGVPGGGWGDPVLRLISTKSGYASLSQLQIILWSFVVGGSAIYVMALSGNLIDITGGTLTLLGISGVATVGSKIDSVRKDKTSPDPANPPKAPGAVAALVATVAGPDAVALAWGRPSDGGAAASYRVSYRRVGAADWIVFTITRSKPGIVVCGLTAGQAYEFEVRAANASGPGDPQTARATTPDWPAGAAAAVQLRLEDEPANTSIGVAWAGGAPNARYRVEWRARDSDGPWQALKPESRTTTSAEIVGLDANAVYDIRVAQAPAPAVGAPPAWGRYATLEAATVGPRIPIWSDLVIETDGADEIEVTRVQMLFFTVVVALFVILRVATSGQIPVIPDSYLLLMGISNGVYLSAKFVS